MVLLIGDGGEGQRAVMFHGLFEGDRLPKTSTPQTDTDTLMSGIWRCGLSIRVSIKVYRLGTCVKAHLTPSSREQIQALQKDPSVSGKFASTENIAPNKGLLCVLRKYGDVQGPPVHTKFT